MVQPNYYYATIDNFYASLSPDNSYTVKAASNKDDTIINEMCKLRYAVVTSFTALETVPSFELQAKKEQSLHHSTEIIRNS